MTNKEIIMPFGTFKGTLITEVQCSYLLWLYKQDWFKAKYKEIYNFIKRHKNEIIDGYNAELVSKLEYVYLEDIFE